MKRREELVRKAVCMAVLIDALLLDRVLGEPGANWWHAWTKAQFRCARFCTCWGIREQVSVTAKPHNEFV